MGVYIKSMERRRRMTLDRLALGVALALIAASVLTARRHEHLSDVLILAAYTILGFGLFAWR